MMALLSHHSWIYKKLQALLPCFPPASYIVIKRATFIRNYNFAGKLAQSFICTMLLFCTTLISTASIDEQKMRQIMQERFGLDGVAVLNAWHNLILDLANRQQQEKIHKVNEFFNQNIAYRDDVTLWRKSDYWATPLETMGMRAGDCEDFTIAKYMTLLRLGIPMEQLRLIYVKAQIGGKQSKTYQAHMVLGYYPTTDSIPLVLDNLITRIEPANKRADLHPVFSFNSEGLWVGNTQTQTDSTARLSRWRDLLQRARVEGVTTNRVTTQALTQAQQ